MDGITARQVIYQIGIVMEKHDWDGPLCFAIVTAALLAIPYNSQLCYN